MDSPQSVVSPFKSSHIVEPEKQKSDLLTTISSMNLSDDFMGVLNVYVHQARDIQNICIYHKQDVYAKLCLTSDPENTVCTKIINGGGSNPVFNDNLRLNVKTIESSLKCEIYMMSRVKNYLEDQLLGFALVPLSDVLMKNGKDLEREFSLSSTDLFHSPAGFVQLSLSYTGASPEVMTISSFQNDTKTTKLFPSEFDRIEFPDPKIVNENHMMVCEYLETSEILKVPESSRTLIVDSLLSSESTNGVSSPSITNSESSDSQGHFGPNDKNTDTRDFEGNSSADDSERDKVLKPVIKVKVDTEQNMVQQDIVDMYMKSMQQFTDSLAKMKLPLDIDSRPTSSAESNSNQKSEQGSKTPGSRVFYGSRAFF